LLSQLIGTLTSKGYSVTFDPDDKGTLVTVYFGDICEAQAVGPTPNIALTDCIKNSRLTKLFPGETP
jgi:hypothetical protein